MKWPKVSLESGKTYTIGLNFSHNDLPRREGRQINLQTVHLMRRLPVNVLMGVKKNGS